MSKTSVVVGAEVVVAVAEVVATLLRERRK